VTPVEITDESDSRRLSASLLESTYMKLYIQLSDAVNTGLFTNYLSTNAANLGVVEMMGAWTFEMEVAEPFMALAQTQYPTSTGTAIPLIKAEASSFLTFVGFGVGLFAVLCCFSSIWFFYKNKKGKQSAFDKWNEKVEEMDEVSERKRKLDDHQKKIMKGNVGQLSKKNLFKEEEQVDEEASVSYVGQAKRKASAYFFGSNPLDEINDGKTFDINYPTQEKDTYHTNPLSNMEEVNNDLHSSHSKQQQPLPPPLKSSSDDLPSGWIKKFDEKKQKDYYYNKSLKKSSWKKPTQDEATGEVPSAVRKNPTVMSLPNPGRGGARGTAGGRGARLGKNSRNINKNNDDAL
jgi:hypothetical protein